MLMCVVSFLIARGHNCHAGFVCFTLPCLVFGRYALSSSMNINAFDEGH